MMRLVDSREIKATEPGSDHYPVLIGSHFSEERKYLYHVCFAQRPRRAGNEDIVLALPILRRDELIQRLQSHIQETIAQNTALEKELGKIRHSFAYKLMRFYAPRIDYLLPTGTKRGKFRRMMTVSVRVRESAVRMWCLTR
jgi:hypothetical protein